MSGQHFLSLPVREENKQLEGLNGNDAFASTDDPAEDFFIYYLISTLAVVRIPPHRDALGHTLSDRNATLKSSP